MKELWIVPQSRVSVNASERELLTFDLILHCHPQEDRRQYLLTVLGPVGSAAALWVQQVPVWFNLVLLTSDVLEALTVAAGSLQRDCGNCRDSRRLLRRTDSDSLVSSLVPPTVLHSDPRLTQVSLAYICLCQQRGGLFPGLCLPGFTVLDNRR